ncbi:MAG: hypothetical protein K0R92_2012 [Lachnospiraceae bacterium]|jgi:hypothetical protein|nr:hypothetical protein [Lachnospiraceae bacterium]
MKFKINNGKGEKFMDNSLKGLILAAGVIITCIIVGLGFYVAREAKNTSNNGAGQISGMNSEYQDVNLALYDGLNVSGKEVAGLIEKVDFSAISGFSIIVKTGSNATTGKTYNKTNVTASVTTFAAKGEDDYISPTAQFLGKVERDGNNIIKTITFTQQ